MSFIYSPVQPGGPLSPSSIDTIIYIDGTTYPQSVNGIAAAVAALGSSPGQIVLTPGTYSDAGSTTVTISHDRQHIIGPGKRAVVINCASSRAIPVFTFSAGASVLYQNSIGGFGLIGAGTSKKTGILVQDTSELYIHDIAIQSWTGSTSVGIDLQGRELGTMARMSIVADHPIEINSNPNSSISLDAWHFQDLYLLPSTGQYGVTVANNVSITHWTWDGRSVVTGGGGVIYWNETSASVQSEQVSLSNIHHEQGTTPSNYSFYFARGISANGLADLTLVNCTADVTQNGFFFQKTNGATLVSPRHAQAGGTALNADNTNYNLVIVNPFWQTGSTVTNTALNASYGGSISVPTLTISNPLGLSSGGTAANLSASGGATYFLAQDGSHVISARAITIGDLFSADGVTTTKFLSEAGTWATPAGGGGTVSSIGISTTAAWLTVGSSPVTSTGTITVNPTSGLTANSVLATPNGSTGALSVRALVLADLPFPTGTPSSSTIAVGDGSWGTYYKGTVTSVAGAGDGVIFNIGGGPITAAGTLSLSLISVANNYVLAGPTSGGPLSPAYRALVTADLPVRTASISYVCDGGGSVIGTGKKGQVSIPVNCTVLSWILTSDQSGSAVVDVLRSTYAAFPTTSSIAGSDLPTLSSAQKAENLTISAWGSVALIAGDELQFAVNSATTVTRLNLTLLVSIP